jgi:hypothetical protein
LSLHWDESVHKPQQDACCNNRDDDGGKWHIVFYNRFPDSIRTQRLVLKLRALSRSLATKLQPCAGMHEVPRWNRVAPRPIQSSTMDG